MYLTVVYRSIICGNLTLFNGAEPTDVLCNRIWKKSVVANSVAIALTIHALCYKTPLNLDLDPDVSGSLLFPLGLLRP